MPRLTLMKSQVRMHQPTKAVATTTNPRPRGSSWMATRDRIFTRDHGMCQPCKTAGRLAVAAQVDHIIPREQRGSDDDSNLQSICDDCHKTKTKAEARMRSMTAAKSQG